MQQKLSTTASNLIQSDRFQPDRGCMPKNYSYLQTQQAKSKNNKLGSNKDRHIVQKDQD